MPRQAVPPGGIRCALSGGLLFVCLPVQAGKDAGWPCIGPEPFRSLPDRRQDVLEKYWRKGCLAAALAAVYEEG